MEIEINYKIDVKIVTSIRKILMHISDTDMSGDYGLDDLDRKNIHEFNDFTSLADEEVGK